MVMAEVEVEEAFEAEVEEVIEAEVAVEEEIEAEVEEAIAAEVGEVIEAGPDVAAEDVVGDVVLVESEVLEELATIHQSAETIWTP